MWKTAYCNQNYFFRSAIMAFSALRNAEIEELMISEWIPTPPIGLSVLFQSYICHSLGAGTHFQSVFGIGGQCEVHVQMCLYGVGNRIQTAVSVSVYGLGIALIGDGDLCADAFSPFCTKWTSGMETGVSTLT